MAIVVLGTASKAFGSGGGTISVSTAGSNLIVVAMSYIRPTTPTLSDGFGNTYTQLTKFEDANSNGSVMIWYNYGGTMGSTHSWTTNCRLGVTSVIAASGARSVTTPFDQVTGSCSNASPTIPDPWFTGTITPSVDDCLLVTCVCQNAGVGAPGVPTGYTLVGAFPVGTSFPGGAAYKIQTASAAENPGWDIFTTANVSSTVADFMPPLAAVVYNPNYNFFMFFGN